MGPENRKRELAPRISAPSPIRHLDIGGVETILNKWAFDHGHSKELQKVLTYVVESLAPGAAHSYFVMKGGDQVVGFAGIRPLERDLKRFNPSHANARQLAHLFVREDFKKQGVGRRLLVKAQREAEKEGAEYLLVKSPYIYKETVWGFFDRHLSYAGTIRHTFGLDYAHVWRMPLPGTPHLTLVSKDR